MIKCRNCKCELTRDDVGLYRKIVTREAESFLCIPCLAEKLAVAEEDLCEMVERFRKAGCQLFAGG